jgi:ADP-ribosyl-[dinitrogen reductase] hydrolase
MAEQDEATAIADRALGAYLGLAIGDALGATVAHLSAREIALEYGVHSRLIGGGWLGLKPGQVTDDTEMALCIGRALTKTAGWNLRAVCDEFAAWLRSAPIDVGHACRRGFRRYIVEGTVHAVATEGHATNGACARNLPVVLTCLGRPEKLDRCTLDQCHISHHHTLADAAAVTLARMTQALILGHGMTAGRAEANALVREHPVFMFKNYRGPCSADIVDTVRMVLCQYFAADDLRTCLITTVNQGGDADTSGALVGMLAGATWGTAALPAEWLRRLDRTVAAEIRAQVPALLQIAGVSSAAAIA